MTDGEPTSAYPVPPQRPAPPDTGRPRAWGAEPGNEAPGGPPAPWSRLGPPIVPPEEPVGPGWTPREPRADRDRWAPAAGGTALLDRPAVRRPLVAPPVRPLPPPPPSQSWDWDRSHGLRNALVAAAVILLLGSLIAAFIVLRARDANSTDDLSNPPPLSTDPTLPLIGGAGATTIPPTVPPASIQPVVPATTVPTTPPATAPVTSAATTPTTKKAVAPTVTASPPYTGGPIPTTVPRTTSTTTPTPG